MNRFHEPMDEGFHIIYGVDTHHPRVLQRPSVDYARIIVCLMEWYLLNTKLGVVVSSNRVEHIFVSCHLVMLHNSDCVTSSLSVVWMQMLMYHHIGCPMANKETSRKPPCIPSMQYPRLHLTVYVVRPLCTCSVWWMYMYQNMNVRVCGLTRTWSRGMLCMTFISFVLIGWAKHWESNTFECDETSYSWYQRIALQSADRCRLSSGIVYLLPPLGTCLTEYTVTINFNSCQVVDT